MGTDPHGLVFYGFALVDEDGYAIEPEGAWRQGEHDSLYVDWEEFYIQTTGGLEEPVDDDYHSPEWAEYRAKREALLKAGGVSVELAGYDENLIKVICIKETWTRAEWAEVLPIKSLEVHPEWARQLRAWCEVMGILWQEPGWYVAALYF